MGKARVQAQYHWDCGADAQFGEVDYNTGSLQLSTLLNIDKNTSVTSGPVATGVTPAPRITIGLNGYVWRS